MRPPLASADAEAILCLTLSRGTWFVGGGDMQRSIGLFRAWRNALISLRNSPLGQQHQLQHQQAPVTRENFLDGDRFYFQDVQMLAWRNYSMARTRGNLLVFLPEEAKVGDEIALLKGGELPFVLRRRPGQANVFRLVAAAYIHGVMFGERWDEKHCQDICLV